MKLTRVYGLRVMAPSMLVGGIIAAQGVASQRTLAARDVLSGESTAAAEALLAQRVSLNLDRLPLRQAVNNIAATAGVRIIYQRELADASHKVVTLRASRIALRTALEQVLDGTQLQLVALPEAQIALVERRVVAAGVITGRVIDANTKDALKGVSVVLDGATQGVITGEDGRYRIAAVAAGTHVIAAKYIGYAQSRRTVTVADGQTITTDFALEQAANPLENIVVTGTITPTQQKAIGVPITVVTAAQIQERGYTTIEQLFKGEVPNVVAFDLGTGNTGDAGGGVTMLVRGSSNLTTARNSVGLKTYIDGIEVQGPLNNIDPKSIERIEIIRGPEAAALYGAEAMNGVMQIFTKQGSSGSRPRVSLQLGIGTLESDYLRNFAVRHDDGLSVDGGGDAFSYSATGSYVFNGASSPGYFTDVRGLTAAVRRTEGPVSARASARFANRKYGYGPEQFRAQRIGSGAFRYSFPEANLIIADGDRSNRQQTLGAEVSYVTTSWWQQQLRVGRDQSDATGISFPQLKAPSDTFKNVSSSSSIRNSVYGATTLTGQVLPMLKATLTGGTDYWRVGNNSYSAPQTPVSTGTIATTGATVTRVDEWNKGYFGQLQLGIADHLFLNGGLRFDTSPRFGSEFGWSRAPSLGVSYVHDVGGATVKLRTSYGRAIHLPPATATTFFTTGPFLIHQPNEFIAPERQRGGDAGIEVYAGSLLSLSVTGYDQTVFDLLSSVVLSDLGVIPQTVQDQNVGEIRNKGWELESTLNFGVMSLRTTYGVADSRVQSLGPHYTGNLKPGDHFEFVPRTNGSATLRLATGGTTASVTMMSRGETPGTDWARFYSFTEDRLYRAPYVSTQFYTMLPPATSYDVNFSRDLRRGLTVFARGENITSANMSYYNYLNTSGRRIMFGLRAVTQ